MREIKFQAWDERNNEMLTWEYIDQLDKDGIEPFMDMVKDPNYKMRQFTGLKDKKGKEIYEGDIVDFQWIDGDRGEIKCIDGCFKVCGMESFHDIPLFLEYPKIKVIGNIYENPELLEEHQ